MKKITLLVSAMRLRTLPLSLSGIILGILLAVSDFHVDLATALLVALTTVLLQITSNVSNELGDYIRGTASGDSRESAASLSSGELSEKSLRTVIYTCVALTVISGLSMIWCSFGTFFCLDAFVLVLLGFFAIKAALKYTLGKNPYGYRGLGDLYVFIFFGLVAVIGSYFVCTHSFGTFKLLLPACSIGFLSVGVLNVNNIRDMESDRATRVTVAIKLGERGAKIYHSILIFLAWSCMIAYCLLNIYDIRHYLFVLTLPLFAFHLAGVWRNSGKALDRQLPVLVLSSFVFAVLAGIGFVAYLF
ncbi:MAG: 1,4-dihydroxy-2-naphthoate octaprenyltransferase [Candidatus Cryptobacteroides sp.]